MGIEDESGDPILDFLEEARTTLPKNHYVEVLAAFGLVPQIALTMDWTKIEEPKTISSLEEFMEFFGPIPTKSPASE